MVSRHRIKHLFLFTAAVVLLSVAACSPGSLLERLRRDSPGAQIPPEMATLWEVYQHLDQDFGGKAIVDQRLLSKGAIEGMLDVLEENGQQVGAPEEYNLGLPDLGAVWQAWQDVSGVLEDGALGLTPGQVQEAAIRGMLAALGDPYTSYLPPSVYALELQSYSSDFEGIGAYVAMSNDQVTIVAPIQDTPAERAGILAGDIVLEVNGIPTTGLSLAETTSRIRGPQGTPVELLILHPNEETPVLITVVRDLVRAPTAVWRPLTDDIAYLRISQFLDGTDEEVEQALREITSKEFEALIVDVRHNLGGLLSTAVSITSQFLTDGLVLYQVDGQGNRTDVQVQTGGLATEIPLVVLVNGASASASEILAGALQDYGRATIIGSSTFGKGSVNELRKLKDGAGLYLTSALWYTPQGRLIEGEGLEPNILVNIERRVDRDGVTVIDQQLEAAMDYLQSKIASSAGG